MISSLHRSNFNFSVIVFASAFIVVEYTILWFDKELMFISCIHSFKYVCVVHLFIRFQLEIFISLRFLKFYYCTWHVRVKKSTSHICLKFIFFKTKIVIYVNCLVGNRLLKTFIRKSENASRDLFSFFHNVFFSLVFCLDFLTSSPETCNFDESYNAYFWKSWGTLVYRMFVGLSVDLSVVRSVMLKPCLDDYQTKV